MRESQKRSFDLGLAVYNHIFLNILVYFPYTSRIIPTYTYCVHKKGAKRNGVPENGTIFLP